MLFTHLFGLVHVNLQPLAAAMCAYNYGGWGN